MAYRKIRFYSSAGSTAGLIVEGSDFKKSSVATLSRLYPYSEVPKMRWFEASPEYDSFEAAFEHCFAPASEMAKARSGFQFTRAASPAAGERG